MTQIIDRDGRKIVIFFRGSAGGKKQLTAEALKAALHARTSVMRIISKIADPASAACGKLAQTLYDKAVKKILGQEPAEAEIQMWTGHSLLVRVPADLGNFLSDMNGIIIENQYDFKAHKNAVVADAGANIGLFSLYACARGAGKVYAFEPVKETYDMLKNNIAASRMEKVILAVNAALGARRGFAKIKCNTRGEGSAMIVGGNAGVNRGVHYRTVRRVKMLALDDVIRPTVDFIKIDVEGYEGRVLLGAAKLIKAHKPILSFSAYHRPADRKKLTGVVLGLRKDYRITLNTFAEHDLYCE